jgi:hypothetical protein
MTSAPARPVAQVQLYAPTPSSPVSWRLLSGNNRECGRGVAKYPDADTCRIAIKELQRDVGALQRRIRRDEPNRWMWELWLGGKPVVAAGHAFDRLIRCEQAIDRFLEHIGSAGIGQVVVYTGARRWGSAAS